VCSRTFHLRDEILVVVGTHLGGEKYLVAYFHVRQQVADHRFRGTVRRRSIDQLCAAGQQRLYDLAAFSTFCLIVINIKNDRSAEANHRQQLFRFRDRPGKQGLGTGLRQ
jgi:hypothetical protein